MPRATPGATGAGAPVRLRVSPAAPPYGLVVAGGRYAPDPARPDRAALVGELFSRYADGETLPGIAAALDARGVGTEKGGAWRPSTILRMLGHEGYRALVDPATWRKAQARREAGWRAPRAAKPAVSWLDGSVRHACGAEMGLHAGKVGTGGRRLTFFRCARAGGCGVAGATASARRLEPAAATALGAEPRVPAAVRRALAEGTAGREREIGAALRRSGWGVISGPDGVTAAKRGPG